jgi:gliding motility-associated-like protein
MSINCSSGDVFTLGGGHNSNLSAATISNLTMNLSFATFQPGNPDPRQDISSHCIDDNGTVFVIYSSIANLVLNNEICRVNSTFNGNVWTQPSTFDVMAEASNKLSYLGSGSASSNGLNCLAVNNSYLFYYDGYNLAAYSKATGTKITSITFSGASPNEKGGIAVDDCNNLYLGGVGQILTCHFSGTNFNLLSSISLGSGNSSSVIFDIKLNKINNTLFACGSGFVGNLTGTNSSTCTATSAACINSYPINYILCGGGSATLTPINYLNLSNPSYSILPGPFSNANGTFVVTPNTTTTYTTYVTGTNTNNAVVTLTSISTVSVSPSFIWTPPSANLILSCNQPSLTINYIPPIYNYTTFNGTSPPQIGTSAVFTNTNYAGNWTVTAVDPASGCSRSQTLTVLQNLITTNSVLSPTFQVIDCANTAITSVTSQITPSINVQHIWMSPYGGSLIATTYTSSFLPGAPGIYTHVAVNNTNGCFSIQTFTVYANPGFPTFNIQSPQNFTLGCASKSLATMNITSGQTSPPGGSILYCFMPPGFSGVSNFSSNSTTITPVAGTWTISVKDILTSCESKVQVSIVQNTFSPVLDTLIIPQTILNCEKPFTTLYSWSSTYNTSYIWSFPGTPGNIQSHTLTVNANTLNITNTLVANFTLTITDNNNSCITKTTVPIAQNLFPPKPAISLSEKAISCLTNSVTLTNQSSTGIPISSGFPNSNFVVAESWQGPSPQTEAHLTTTYLAKVPGTYTLIAKDLANGCQSSTTAIILDNIIYPNVNIPSGPPPFILSCDSKSASISPNLIPKPSYRYLWTLPADSIVIGTINQLNLITTSIGNYTLKVTDESNGCASAGTVQVINDSLFGAISSNPENGYASLSVQFTNQSSSKTGNKNIKTIWDFENENSLKTDSVSVSPKITFTQPGNYKVTAFVIKGRCLDTAYTTIRVEISSAIELPNIFTPNGDGANDEFFIQSSSLKNLEIIIIDLWGVAVYSLKTNKTNIVWDGKNQYGIDAAEGVYFYVLKAEGLDGKTFERKGNITLLR